MREEIFNLDGSPRKYFATYFQKWHEIFSRLYPLREKALDLYLRQAYFVLYYKSTLEFRHLQPDFSSLHEIFGWVETGIDIVKKFYECYSSEMEENCHRQFIAYHDLISSKIRHALGEIYTPYELASAILDYAMILKPPIEWKILDPACGDGIFLTTFLEKILYSEYWQSEDASYFEQNLVGFDINPLAVFATIANLQLFFDENHLPAPDHFNIILLDPLFADVTPNLEYQFTHIIGNPPWYNLAAVQTRDYQEQLKSLAREMEIHPYRSANIPNIEIASLFLRRIARDFLAPDGIVSFLMPRNLLKGSQNGRVRLFPDLQNVEIWDFGQLSFFAIEFLALFALEARGIEKRSKEDFVVGYHKISSTKLKENAPWEFTLGPLQHYCPVTVDLSHKNAGRLVSQEILTKIPLLKESPYMSLFHNGARLGPRCFLFVHVEMLNLKEVCIRPDPAEVATCRGQWRQLPYEMTTVHPENIFPCAMSKDLVPFAVLEQKRVFLPVSRELKYCPKSLDPQSQAHFNQMSKIYNKLKKRDARQETLWDYITYNGKTTNPRQIHPLKVIYNSIGRKRVKAAILRDFALADDSLYYFTPDSETEAFYLTAVLNSNLVSFAVVNIKDERNIHKNPWRLPIPLWEQTPIQQEIAFMGQAMEHKIMVKLRNGFGINGKNAVEAQILAWVGPELSELDNLMRNLFKMQ